MGDLSYPGATLGQGGNQSDFRRRWNQDARVHYGRFCGYRLGLLQRVSWGNNCDGHPERWKRRSCKSGNRGADNHQHRTWDSASGKTQNHRFQHRKTVKLSRPAAKTFPAGQCLCGHPQQPQLPAGPTERCEPGGEARHSMRIMMKLFSRVTVVCVLAVLLSSISLMWGQAQNPAPAPAPATPPAAPAPATFLRP